MYADERELLVFRTFSQSVSVRLAHYGARRRRAPRLVQNLTRLRRYEKP